MSETRTPPTVMIFQALGTPSGLSYACFALLQAIVDALYGRHELIQAVFLDDVRERWTARDRSDLKPVIIISDCPSTALTGIVKSTRLPFLLVFDDFADTVREVVANRNMPLPEALRFVTQSICTVAACRGEETISIMRRDLRRSVSEILARLAAHFGLEDSDEVAARALAGLGYAPDGKETLLDHMGRLGLARPAEAETGLARDTETETILRTMGASYDRVVRGEPVKKFEWPTEMFLDWDRPGQFLRSPVQLLGPARFIICGPYFHLPAGSWSARVHVELSGNASGNRMNVDVFSGEILAGVAMPLPAAGVFSFEIPFQVVDPFLPVELRFQSLEGAIEGSLQLRSAVFERRD